MDVATVIAIGSILIAAVLGYWTNRTSRKKEPEDRRRTDAETDEITVRVMEKVLERVDRELEGCEEARKVLMGEFEAHKKNSTMAALNLTARVKKLEAEVIRLGGNPDNINGGPK